MSRLIKLGFSGVRSFGPDEEQRLRFQAPITVILGANGTGKTTIVECLRLATTGELPPLVDKGAAFVHDPRLRESKETKAKIRLLFEDALGRQITVNRQLQLRLTTAGKQSFSTVETSLSIRDKDGQHIKTSNRCNDINAMAPAFLGVRQAVLENVIFVHQEESLWPLQDPKKVKEKFDDIFEARGYAKALIAIQKCAQQKLAELKILHSELERWRDRLENLKQKQRNCRSMQAQCLEWSNSLGTLETELSEKIRAVTELEEARAKEVERRRQLQALRDEIRIRTEERDRLWRELGKELTETTQDLERLLTRITAEYSQVDAEYRKASEESLQLQKQLQLLRDREQRLQEECAAYSCQQAAIERQRASCAELLREIQKSHSIDGTDIGEGAIERSAKDLIHILERSRNDCEREMEHFKRLWEDALQREQKLKLELESDQRQAQQIRNEIAILEEACAETAARLQSLPMNVEIVAMKSALLVQFQAEKQQVDEELSNQTDMDRMSTIRKRLEQIFEVRTKNLASRRNDVTHTATRGDTNASAIAAAFQKFREEEEASIQRLLEQRRLPSCSVSEAQDRLASAEHNLSAVRNRIMGTELEMRLRRAICDKESERLLSMRSRLREIDASVQPGTVDAECLKSQISALKRRHLELESTALERDGRANWLEEMRKRVHEQKTCPLCDRAFSGMAEAANVESALARVRNTLTQAADSDSLEYVQDVLNRAEHQWRLLEERAAITLQEQRSISRIRSAESEIQRLEDARRSERTDQQVAELELADARELLWYARRLAHLRQEMAPSGPSSASGIAASSPVVAALEVDTREAPHQPTSAEDALAREETALRGELDTLLGRRQELLVRAQELHDLIQTTEKELTAERAKQHDRDQLEACLAEKRKQRSEKQASLCALDQKVEEALLQAAPPASAALLARLEAVRSRHRAIHTDLIRLENRLQVYIQESRRFEGDAHKLAHKQLETCREQIIQTLAEEAQAVQVVAQWAGQRQNADSYLRQVRDNLRYRQLQEMLVELQQKDAELASTLPMTDEHDPHVSALEAAKAEADTLREKVHHLRGQRDLLAEQLRALTVELDADVFAQAEQQFQALRLQCDVIELVCRDLRNYHRALDLAIMRYHDLKMRSINRVLRELWQSTYLGSDIEEIEIRSDFVADSLPMGRRTYHYRVVMRQGDTWLDMRGRCSAGQKVLACLLIRLALAENFGNACGVLALDEPTTNLDERHVKALAASLSLLIQQRAQQRNFQLILITHEERFLDYLHIREYADSYIYVTRNRQGLSQIQHHSLDETTGRREASELPFAYPGPLVVTAR
jgi:DNA repair protein RAD50